MSIMFKRKIDFHLHTLHLHFGPSNEVVDLTYSGNVFHMFAPKALKLLFPNFVVL